MNHEERSNRIDRIAQRLHAVQDKVEHLTENHQILFDGDLDFVEKCVAKIEINFDGAHK